MTRLPPSQINEELALPDSWRKHDLRTVAEISIAAVGILYATGFLATFTFLERFGIRETGSEFLRLKYVYVGILYFLFPLTIMLPCFALGSLWNQARKDRRARRFGTAAVKLPFASILLVLNMLAVFYIFICFAPVTFIHKRPWVVPAVSVLTIFGALVLRFLADRRLRRWIVKMPIIGKSFWRLLNQTRETRRRFRSRSSETLFRGWRRLVRLFYRVGGGWIILFLLIATIIDRPALRGLWADLNLMTWGDSNKVICTLAGFRITPPIGGFNYFLFVFLYFVVGARVLKRMAQHPSPTRTKYLAGGVGVFFSLFFVSVLAFALRVYPFIPAFKGGGDYRKSTATITLKTKPEFHLTIPKKVVIIEETPSSLFIALTTNPQETAGNTPTSSPPKKPKKTPHEGNWRLWKELPNVLEIPREAVSSVEYKPLGNKLKSDDTGGTRKME